MPNRALITLLLGFPALAALATELSGSQSVPMPSALAGADFGGRSVQVLDCRDGAARIAVRSTAGEGAALLQSEPAGARVILERLALFGPQAPEARVALDSAPPRSADWGEPGRAGAAVFHFERELRFDGRGQGGRLKVLGPTSSGPLPNLPPFTAILRFEPGGELRQFTGFETGDLSEFDKFLGPGVSVQSAVVRSGAFGMRSLANPGEYGYATLFDTDPEGLSFKDLDIDDLYLSFWFRIADWSERVRIAEVGGVGGATKVRVELEPDGRLSLEDDGLTRRYGKTVLALDTWYRIRLRVGTGTATRLQLLVGGSVEVDTSSANTSGQLARRVHIGRAATSGGPSDFYYDDVIVSTDGYPEDGSVLLLAPAAPGRYADWAGECTDVDEWPPDGDLTFASSFGPGALTCTLGPAGAVSGRVLGVKSLAMLRREGSTFSASAVRLRSGGVDADTASWDAGSAYRLRSRIFTSDPASGKAWKRAALTELEVGAVQVDPSAGPVTRATSFGASVLYVPPGS